MKYLLGIFIMFTCVSCTYSITMVYTKGTATDVVDETATNTPTISVPALGLK